MSQSQDERGDQFYAETYDDSVPDWPNEIDFYQEMAAKCKAGRRERIGTSLRDGTGGH